MTQAYAQCSLFLYPNICDFAPKDFSAFISTLQKINFISLPVDDIETHHYFTGDKFLDYIAYMGCAPTITFEKNGNKNFCFIKVLNFTSKKLLHCQQQARAPHCTKCKKPVNTWQDNKTDTTIHCNHCDATSSIEKFNWRKTAAYAKLFIEITDIFPKEAIPQQILLDKLASITNVEWSYFYRCQ